MNHRYKLWLAPLALVAVLTGKAVAETSPPMFIPIGTLPGYQYCEPRAISGDGTTVVGEAPGAAPQAFVWNAKDGVVGLGWLPETLRSGARAISADGNMVVGLSGNVTENGFEGQGFLWTKENGMQPLPSLPGATNTTATAISADGQVIAGNSGTDTNCTMGFRWTSSSGITPVGSLPPNPPFDSQIYGISANGAVLVGNTDVCGESQRAIRWTQSGGMQSLFIINGILATAYAASGNGAVIVGSDLGHAFRWTAGTGYPIANMDVAFSISTDGNVIVGRDIPSITAFAKVWTNDCGTRSLREMLLAAGVSEVLDWNLGAAVDIADDGRTIAGAGTNPQGIGEGFVARLPRKGDNDFDGDVDVDDLLKVINSWGPCKPDTCTFIDGNCDNIVDQTDLISVIDNWDK